MTVLIFSFIQSLFQVSSDASEFSAGFGIAAFYMANGNR